MKNFDTKFFSLLIIFSMLVVVGFFTVSSLDNFSKNTIEKQEENMQKSIEKAAIQCYALEGAYPPNLEYLEEHYGIILDYDTYIYYYDAFAANVRPEIIVKSLLVPDNDTMADDLLDDTSIDFDALESLFEEEGLDLEDDEE